MSGVEVFSTAPSVGEVMKGAFAANALEIKRSVESKAASVYEQTRIVFVTWRSSSST